MVGCILDFKSIHEMHIVSLINDAQIIEGILPSTGPPAGELMAVSGIFERGELVIELSLDDPMPDYDCGL